MGLHRFARKVGFRYLTAKKKSSFLSVTTGISVGGVFVGVTTLVVTLSVMGGFESELRKRLFEADTHVLVQSTNSGNFPTDLDLLERIKGVSPKPEAVFPVLQAEAILRSGKKVSGAILKGAGSDQLAWIKRHVVEWAAESMLSGARSEGAESIFVGSELAYELGVIPGDYLTAVSPMESDGPMGAVPRVKRFVVEGVYKTGVPEQELHAVFAPARAVESFLRAAGVISGIEVRMRSLEDAESASATIRHAVGEKFLVRSWQELNEHLFRSLRLERITMFVILAFIIVVASFNIMSTMTMTVLEKRRSLSILRAIGATRSQIRWVFLWEGVSIAMVGILGGGGAGLFVCWLLKTYPIIELPDYYYDRTLPIFVNWGSIGGVAVVALAIVLVAAQWPASQASKLTPLEGIREGAG